MTSPSLSPTVPRLTDQALVAVHVGTALATGAGTTPNVAHLVAGLAGAPEGMAGRVLRQRFGEVAPRLALQPALDAASLPRLDTAYVALPVLDRPCWTLELLHAARRVGGEDLEFLLQASGVDLAWIEDDLRHRMPGALEVDDDVAVAETFGRLSLVDAHFTAAADLAIARVRAHGGDSRALLTWLGADEPTRAALQGAPAVAVEAVVARAALGGGATIAVDGRDLVTAITHLSLRAALDRR